MELYVHSHFCANDAVIDSEEAQLHLAGIVLSNLRGMALHAKHDGDLKINGSSDYIRSNDGKVEVQTICIFRVPSKPAYHMVTYIERHIPEVVLIQLTLLMTSTWLLETCRELE